MVMTFQPPESIADQGASAQLQQRPFGDLAKRWSKLQVLADTVADFAGASAREQHFDAREIIELLGQAGAWKRQLASESIDDIEAMMRLGIAALQVVAARGQDMHVPALALWRECCAARGSVLALLGKTPAVEPADITA